MKEIGRSGVCGIKSWVLVSDIWYEEHSCHTALRSYHRHAAQPPGHRPQVVSNTLSSKRLDIFLEIHQRDLWPDLRLCLDINCVWAAWSWCGRCSLVSIWTRGPLGWTRTTPGAVSGWLTGVTTLSTTMHSGRNQGFLSNGCIGCIYLV